jgi:hypothetical protein
MDKSKHNQSRVLTYPFLNIILVVIAVLVENGGFRSALPTLQKSLT